MHGWGKRIHHILRNSNGVVLICKAEMQTNTVEWHIDRGGQESKGFGAVGIIFNVRYQNF
jgi:hypothetical protein